MSNKGMNRIIEGLHIDEAKTQDKSKTRLSELKKGDIVVIAGFKGDYVIKTAGKKYKIEPVNPDDNGPLDMQFFRPENVEVAWSDKVDKYVVYRG